MRRLGRVFGAVVAVSFVGVVTVPGGAAADDDHHGAVKVLLDGLNSPKGLALNTERNLVVGQGAFGPPSPALLYILHGPDRGNAFEVTAPANLIDVAISPLDGTGWGIGNGLLLHQLADGTVVTVLDIGAYQAGDPDPVDQDGDPGESNPYGLTIAWNGDALFTDAANNDLVRVTPDGVATTVARFDLEVVSTDHLGDPTLPPEMTAEAVPTTVTLGPDGWIYVGELKGFPFRPGSSNIWRIKPWADGAWCSVTTPDPSCRLYSTGFTAIQDLAFNRQNGKMYVYELAEDGVLAFEAGLPGENGEPPTGPMPPAVLLEVWRRWHDDDADRRGDGHCDKGRELAAGQLFEPGGVVVDRRGQVFVTDGVFSGGRLLKVLK